MLFNSWPFVYLLAITLFLYHVVLKNTRMGRQVMLLIASYIFYGWWDWRYLSLIMISTAIDYLISNRIDDIYKAGGTQRETKRLVTASIVMNLGMLGFFKYFNFFADNFEGVLSIFGFRPSWLTLNVLLPVGISFYTFQSMAYTIDVYRKAAPVIRNAVTFFLYVSFFPQLVAGPIERAQDLAPQLDAPKRVGMDRIQSGIVLLILGFFKKMVIADPIFPYVHEVLDDPAKFSGIRLLMTLYLFTFHIYADFSGYSDIARGAARLFGVDLTRNFEQPYFSTSVNELWRRWHITLMSWFRDYLFIPLGGSRVPPRRVYFNIMMVMGLSGLWHGAGWSWLAWGLFNGVQLCAERYAKQRRIALGISEPVLTPMSKFLRAVWVYHLFCAGAWIYLNPEWKNFKAFTYGLCTRWRAWSDLEISLFGWLLVYAAITFFIDHMQRRTRHHEFPLLMRPVWGGLIIGAMVVAVIFWSVTKGVPYFYFQF